MTHKYVYKFLFGFLAFANFAHSGPLSVQCFDKEANTLVETHFRQWKALQEKSGSSLTSPLNYCDSLAHVRDTLSSNDEEKRQSVQILTLIYTVGAHFGLVPAKTDEEKKKADSHLQAIADSTLADPEGSIAIESLHCKINNSFGGETINPNIAFLKNRLDTAIKTSAAGIDVSSIKTQAGLALITWFRFLAGDEIAKIRIANGDVNIYDVHNFSDDQLEKVHNFIQVIFPNYRSGMRDSYYLANETLSNNKKTTPQTIFSTLWNCNLQFRNLYVLNLKRSFYRMMKFYGLRLENISAGKNKLVRNIQDHESKWSGAYITKWRTPDHNTLRLTRILIALRSARLDNLADIFFNALQEFSPLKDNPSRGFWKSANDKNDYAF